MNYQYAQRERQSSFYIVIMNYCQNNEDEFKHSKHNLEYEKVWLFEVALNKSLSLTPFALMRRFNHALEFGVVPSWTKLVFEFGKRFCVVICKHLFYRTIFKFDLKPCNLLPQVVILGVNVFIAIMVFNCFWQHNAWWLSTWVE